MKNWKLFIIPLILTIGSSHAQSTMQSDISGHWHMYYIGNKLPMRYFKLDIIDDTIALLENIHYPKMKTESKEQRGGRNIDHESKRMLLWIGGGVERLTYSMAKNDLMFLSEYDKPNEFKYFAFRLNSSKCELEVDYYSSSKVAIQLRELKMKDTIDMSNRSNTLEIYLGTNKATGKKSIEMNGRILKNTDLQWKIELEKFKMKVPLEKRESLKVILNIDKDYPIDRLQKICEKLKAANFKLFERLKTENGEVHLVNYE